MLFQSSPTPKRGRYVNSVSVTGDLYKVSILAHAEARALLEVTRTRRQAGRVSILAHAEARALPSSTLPYGERIPSFQSSPTPKRGRYVVDGQRCRLEAVVSILAHAEARALPALDHQ